MSTYTADVSWRLKSGEDFRNGRYSRGHTISFDGGTVVPASASPHVVGKWAVVAAVDPEEMLVAALSNCHMLSFLHVARLAGFSVAAYSDHAEGVMEEIAPGKQAVTKVALHPLRAILLIGAAGWSLWLGWQIAALYSNIFVRRIAAMVPLAVAVVAGCSGWILLFWL